MTSNLPCLPGFSFNTNLRRTYFPLDPKFDYIGGVPALREKVKPNLFGPLTDSYPSFYVRGENVTIPAWLAYDKHILCFDAIVKEQNAEEDPAFPHIRKAKVYFYLEDGTVQVVEPSDDSTGVSRSVLISRHRIRLPGHMDDVFYDIIDFNIGREIELYSKVFKLVNCDKFTRNFLNRWGVSVPDPIFFSNEKQGVASGGMTKKIKEVNPMVKFLANDKKVLRFFGHWDDKGSLFGYVHNLEILFYLSDDTIEIIENEREFLGRSFTFLKRGKLPKSYRRYNPISNKEDLKFLTKDPLSDLEEIKEYYKDSDFRTGDVINVYGRKIVLDTCDNFTKDYLTTKYNVKDGVEVKDDIKSKPECKTKKVKTFIPKHEPEILQYHEPKLRFRAKMITEIKENQDRDFVISYQLSDGTLAVFEYGKKNLGYPNRQFFGRNRVRLPQEKDKEIYYTQKDLFVGAILIINNFYFVLISADEFTLKYMEEHGDQFPKSNINKVMDKVKTHLRPIYKQFIQEQMPLEPPQIPYKKLRDKLVSIMGENRFSEQEMITIYRAFSIQVTPTIDEKDELRAVVHNKINNEMWDDKSRLIEFFVGRDPHKSGKVSQAEAYKVMKICRVPISCSLLKKIIELTQKDEDGHIYYGDLLSYIDESPKEECRTGTPKDPKKPEIVETYIDWNAFNRYLNLESTLKDN